MKLRVVINDWKETETCISFSVFLHACNATASEQPTNDHRLIFYPPLQLPSLGGTKFVAWSVGWSNNALLVPVFVFHQIEWTSDAVGVDSRLGLTTLDADQDFLYWMVSVSHFWLCIDLKRSICCIKKNPSQNHNHKNPYTRQLWLVVWPKAHYFSSKPQLVIHKYKQLWLQF